jgi:hypothetical protein
MAVRDALVGAEIADAACDGELGLCGRREHPLGECAAVAGEGGDAVSPGAPAIADVVPVYGRYRGIGPDVEVELRGPQDSVRLLSRVVDASRPAPGVGVDGGDQSGSAVAQSNRAEVHDGRNDW